MIIIDGEEVKLECRDCGERYSHIIGYGPFCPTLEMRKESLRRNPPKCPACGSRSYKELGLFDHVKDWFK